MNLIHALILGVVEGITEFLPISSTAHLEITARLLSLPATSFLKSFEIIIQLGAILAVVVLYARMIIQSRDLWKKTLVAFIPTGIIGFGLYKIVKTYFLGNASLIVWTLGIGGLLLIVFEFWHKKREAEDVQGSVADISYTQALVIGCAQSLALVPGVSRSASAIVAGLAMRMSRKAIVEFSFLLAIPTMAAATGYDLLKNASSFSQDEIGFLTTGFIAAFISALIAVKFLLHFVQRRTFISFGVYRIILAIILLLSL